jgi:hypothetical protein
MVFGAQAEILERQKRQAEFYNLKQNDKSYEPTPEMENLAKISNLKSKIILMIQSRDVLYAHWGFDDKTSSELRQEYGSYVGDAVIGLYCARTGKEIIKEYERFSLEETIKKSDMFHWFVNNAEKNLIIPDKEYYARLYLPNRPAMISKSIIVPSCPGPIEIMGKMYQGP